MNVRVFELRSGEPRAVLRGHDAEVTRVTFDSRGDLLASYGWDNTLRLWDPFSGRLRLTVPGHGCNPRFSPDDRLLGHYFKHTARESEGTDIAFWRVARGKALRVLHGHDRVLKGPERVDISPRGLLLASAGADGVRIWTLADGREIAHLRVAGAADALFHPSGRHLITSGSGGLLEWPLALREGALRVDPSRRLELSQRGTPARLSLDADGRRLAVALDSGLCVVRDLESAAETVLARREPGLSRIALSGDGRWLATGTWGRGAGHAKVWNARTGALVKELRFPGERSADVVFSPDGRWLVAGRGTDYRFLRVGSWELGHRVERAVPATNLRGVIAFTRDGRVAAIAHSPTLVKLLEARSGEEILTLEAPEPRLLTSLAFNADGSVLVASTAHRAIQVWDLRYLRQRLEALDLDRYRGDEVLRGRAQRSAAAFGLPRRDAFCPVALVAGWIWRGQESGRRDADARERSEPTP